MKRLDPRQSNPPPAKGRASTRAVYAETEIDAACDAWRRLCLPIESFHFVKGKYVVAEPKLAGRERTDTRTNLDDQHNLVLSFDVYSKRARHVSKGDVGTFEVLFRSDRISFQNTWNILLGDVRALSQVPTSQSEKIIFYKVTNNKMRSVTLLNLFSQRSLDELAPKT